MAVTKYDEGAWRPGGDLLARGFVISIAVHLVLVSFLFTARRFGFWGPRPAPAWLQSYKKTLGELQARKKAEAEPPVAQQEPPLMFVDVNPDVATPEPPKAPKYYSSRNSLAANPEPLVETEKPKLTGTQTLVPKTETAAKTTPAKPAPPKPEEPDVKVEQLAEVRPKGGLEPGDLARAKPEPRPGEGEAADAHGEAPTPTPAPVHKKPRTLAEAHARNALAGEQMKQPGGVRRQSLAPSLDTKATPFGSYDEAMIMAIQSRWYDLIDNAGVAVNMTGRVVVAFRLHHDGRISDLVVKEQTVSDIMAYLCQKGISDPAPFEKWPTEMRMLNGKDYRDLTFTFYYN